LFDDTTWPNVSHYRWHFGEAVMARWRLALIAAVAGCSPGSEITETDDTPPGMVLVEGREFLMGTDSASVPELELRFEVTRDGVFAPELQQHRVEVSDFFLDARDVTNGDFAEFVDAMPQWNRARADSSLHNGRYLEHWTGTGPASDDLDRPVTFVTWYAAAAYCRWRTKRLPTESEWELAAGAGDPANQFPWGSQMPSAGLVSWSGGGHLEPQPVGSHPPTGDGFYDLSGNVWKFLADAWRGSYAEAQAPSGDAAEPADTLQVRRVVRGGSYEANVVNLRVRYRDSHRPFDAREMVGFRCAKSVAP